MQDFKVLPSVRFGNVFPPLKLPLLCMEDLLFFRSGNVFSISETTPAVYGGLKVLLSLGFGNDFSTSGTIPTV